MSTPTPDNCEKKGEVYVKPHALKGTQQPASCRKKPGEGAGKKKKKKSA